MVKKRRRYPTAFKFQGALEPLEGSKTVRQLSSVHKIHANQIGARKRQLLADGHRAYASNGAMRPNQP